jgi:hypothetical protein
MPRLNRRSRDRATSAPLRVMVAAYQPLHRELVRFFLEEGGCQVVALVARGDDAVGLAAEKRPDAAILHESLAAVEDEGLVQRLRHGSESTKIVVITPEPEQAWSGPYRGADAFVEEWVGIQELGPILQRLCRGASVPQPTRAEREAAIVGAGVAAGDDGDPPSDPSEGNQWKGWQARWYERLQGAVAASVILLALFLGPGLFHLQPTSGGAGSSAASVHLTHAYSTLAVLVSSMRTGMSPEVLADKARQLSEERAAAIASGADVTRLDAAIAAEVPPLLPSVTDEGAAAVTAILGDLVTDQVPPPSSEPGPAEGPSPEESPSPEPSETPTPEPTETPSPEPSPTQTPSPEPSPTQTPSPEPSPTQTPSPEPSPTDTPTPSETPSPYPSPSETPSASETPSPTETPSASETPSPTETPSASETPSPTETASPEPSVTESPSPGGSSAPAPFPSAAGLVFVSLPVLSWMRARARKRS